MRMRAVLKICFLLLAVCIAGLSLYSEQVHTSTSPVGNDRLVSTDSELDSEWWEVVSVIDGDTIEVQNREELQRVRYIGIDAPESYPEPSECYAKEATEYNRKLLSGTMVRLVRDKSDTDRYGRWLRYVYVGDVFVNKHLVEKGFAVAKMYQPDTKKSQELAVAALLAQEEKRGLWAECLPEEPLR